MDPKTFAMVFSTVFLAELGDKTQLSTFALAADAQRSKWLVFAASSCALVACSGLATLLGGWLGRVVSPRMLGFASGVLFIALGIAAIAAAWKRES